MGRTNADVPWDDFDAEAYAAANYDTMRDDDRELLTRIRDFFTAECAGAQWSAIDVGPGPNLYPALAMLPFCRDISFWERSKANVDWLNDHLARASHRWRRYWTVLTECGPYRSIQEPGVL